MPLRHVLLATALLAALTGLTACGGGGADPTTSSAVARLFLDHPSSTYGLQEATDGYFEGIELTLRVAGKDIATVPTNAQGEALFGNLTPGDSYTILLGLDSTSLNAAADAWWGSSTPWTTAPSGVGGDASLDSDASTFESPPSGHVEVTFVAPDAGDVNESLGIGFSPVIMKVKPTR